MEKKRLGRGLEEISNIFLSTSKETKEEKMTYGFSPVALREDSCASCTNLFQGPSGQAKCRIFSMKSEEFGVRTIDSIALNYARNCEHFEPITPEKMHTTDVSRDGYSYQAEDQCEVEETVNVRRTVAFQNDENVQQNIRKALSEHLREGYSIRRVELKKIEDISESRSRVHTEENVTIFIKSCLSA